MKNIVRYTRELAVLFVTTSLAAGCAHLDSDFKKSVQQLIDCEYKYASQPQLSCKEIADLQVDCYMHYQMRGNLAAFRHKKFR